ncbi:MAG TPA: protein kinase [Gemmataceae bacterium]|nr:protein kinase [Gemmataceae bacterium]
MSIDPKRQDHSAQDVEPETTAELTPDLAPTEIEPAPSRLSIMGDTTETETLASPADAPGGKTLDPEETRGPVSGAPITGMPGGEETTAYDPHLAKAMPGSLDETQPQLEHPGVGRLEDTEFIIGAGGRPSRYVLKKFHAKGGMGEIWLADDIDVGRSVALKRMRSGREGNREKFFMEARITGRLEHPGIVPVHELGEDEQGRPFYIMKFVHGPTLKDRIKEYHDASSTSATPREVQQLRLLENFVSLCQTVAYAHSKGIIHRDIKPDNVMLGEYGETLVLDWGIAKMLGQAEGPEYSMSSGSLTISGESHETEMGTIKGTPSYFAPEMAAGLVTEIDQRSDVYLLGATLYQILTGQRPRKGTSLQQIIALARSAAPPAPRRLMPGIPRALEAICLKAMSRNKGERYADALKLAEDVQRYLAGEPVSAYPEPLLARAWRWARKHRRVLGQAAAALLVVAIAGFAYAEIRHAQKKAEAARVQAQRLEEEKLARAQVEEFHGLADEARFYLANLSPVSENAPYYDIDKAEKAGRAALAVADKWGPQLDDLPLPDGKNQLKKELYDLLLMLAGGQALQATDATPVPAMSSLLDRARTLAEPTRGYYRLRAASYQLDGKTQEAARAQERADDPKVEMTALDHFLRGEEYRVEAVSGKYAPMKLRGWEPNRELYGKAMEEYRLALKSEPDHYWSHFQQGRLYADLTKYGEAVEAFSSCIAIRPKAIWGYASRGNALAKLKRFAEAEADLDKVIADRSDTRPARLAKGFVYATRFQEEKHEGKDEEAQRNADKALAEFEAALQLPADKQLIEAAFYRAILYAQRREKGDPEKAMADFDRVVKEKPNFYRVYHTRAGANFAVGKNEEGLKDLTTYVTKGKPFDEQNAEAHEQRGRLLRLLIPDLKSQVSPQAYAALWVLAGKDLKKAIDLGGKSFQLYDDFGAVLQTLGQAPAAIVLYTKALEQEPGNSKALAKRGWAQAGQKQYDKARADFAAIIKDHADHAEAHVGLAYVAACQNKQAEAFREANLALLHREGDFLILHNVACVYAELSEADSGNEKQFQDLAMDQLRRAVELWRREVSTLDEIALIKGEPSFRPSMRARADFRRLTRQED